MYTPLTTSYLNICFTESMECVFWTVIFTIKWTCDSHGNSESYLPCTLTFFISQEKQNLHGYLPQEKNLKSHAWKMAIFRAENGHFPGWDLPLDNDLFPPWKWPFPTLKMTIFHPEKSQAWKKAIFRVEFFFKKIFTGLENGQNHSRNSKFHAFDLEFLKNPRAEKISPRKWPFSMHGI